MKKQIISFITILFLVIFFSGCGKKQESQNIINLNNNIGEQAERDEQPVEDKSYEIKSKENGWVTFESRKCNFEISYPENFKEFDDCQNHESDYILTLINYFDENDERRSAMVNWRMYLSLSKIEDDVNNLETWVHNNTKVGGGYSVKTGETKSFLKEIEFLGSNAFIQDIEYEDPIEGPSGVNKNFYFLHNNSVYLFSGQIPEKNSEQIELFSKISETINFLN